MEEIGGLIIVIILIGIYLIKRWAKNAVEYPEDYEDDKFLKK